jgi:hypothetical protein
VIACKNQAIWYDGISYYHRRRLNGAAATVLLKARGPRCKFAPVPIAIPVAKIYVLNSLHYLNWSAQIETQLQRQMLPSRCNVNFYLIPMSVRSSSNTWLYYVIVYI